ncbi:helix-turn-helix domain-containing protein [Pedobacter sp. L105]|uniref:winged helix-turn-helix transcriptional regulator n=1 Tax=Pedobacter sp. L105 TaxID=1641871 RepID=UPI00131D4958|nr:helix-turn-helix domain-containing protein [Pedobacter sp. L105]
MESINQEKEDTLTGDCGEWIMPVKDALDALHGRWKIPIIIAVSFGSKRFNEIAREVPGITDKTLSKELKDLEVNQLVSRKVINSFPTRVEYAITDHGRSLKNVMIELRLWGRAHRAKIFE